MKFSKLGQIIQQGEEYMTHSYIRNNKLILRSYKAMEQKNKDQNMTGIRGFLEFWFNTGHGQKVGKSRLYSRSEEFIKAKGNLWHNAFVIVDEAHELVPKEAQEFTPSIILLQDQFWKSRELHGEQGVKVLLLTATPMTTSPIDLINLINLLVPKEEAIPLLTDEQFAVALKESMFNPKNPKLNLYKKKFDDWRQIMQSNFDEMFPYNPDTKSFENEEKIENILGWEIILSESTR